jgi:hypothetical protein
VLRGLAIALEAPTLFSRLLAGAVTMIFFTYAFVNMGMVSGILPVVGVPLPFISYGGTAMVTLGHGAGHPDVDRQGQAAGAVMSAPLGPVAIVGVGNMGGGMAAGCWSGLAGAGLRPRGGQGAGAGGQGANLRPAPRRWPRPAAALIVCVVDAARPHEVLFGAAGAAARWRPARPCCCAPPSRRRRGAPGRGAGREVRTAADRCADVRRPGARPRRQHEPDGGLRRRAFERQRAARGLEQQGVPRRHAARRRRPHQAGEQPAGRHQPGRRGRSAGDGRSASGWTRRARSTSSSSPAARAGSAPTACAAPSPATTRRARTSRCCRRTPGWR